MVKKPVIFGEVLYDCFEEDGSCTLGGAPFNVAWHLQGFGLSPRLISRVGDDPSGYEIEATMQQWNMSTDGLQWDHCYPTGKVSIRLDNGQPSFNILSDQAYDYIDAGAIPSLNPSILYHGSLGIRNSNSVNALNALIDQYHPRIFLDVNLRPPWWRKEEVLKIMNHTSWLKINDDELISLEDGGRSLEDKARLVSKKYGMDLVIVTQGKDGAMALNRNDDINYIRPEDTVDVVDTVGAGDAFSAVCILGLIKQWPIPLTLERAQLFASMIVCQRGATINDASVYKQLVTTWSH